MYHRRECIMTKTKVTAFIDMDAEKMNDVLAALFEAGAEMVEFDTEAENTDD